MTRPICILHLSDLHFSGTADADIKIVIAALVKDINREVNEKKTIIDLVVFSGDLVEKGGTLNLFEEAKKDFIEKVITAAKISGERFVICPGNHDIDRELVRREAWAEAGLLATLKSRHEINNFIDAHLSGDIAGTLAVPIQRLENYYKAVWLPRTGNATLVTPFVIAYNFSILNQDIGVACFNSAWRTTGEPGVRHG
jgi:predicted MPP superfamily phosphohydrolase